MGLGSSKCHTITADLSEITRLEEQLDAISTDDSELRAAIYEVATRAQHIQELQAKIAQFFECHIELQDQNSWNQLSTKYQEAMANYFCSKKTLADAEQSIAIKRAKVVELQQTLDALRSRAAHAK